MNTLGHPIHQCLLAACMLFLSSCSSTDPGIAEPVQEVAPSPSRSSTMMAQKSLALLYLELAEEQLSLIKDDGQQQDIGLAIAETYALLSERDKGMAYLLPAVPFPNDAAGVEEYLSYISVLAAFGDYTLIEAAIEQIQDPQIECVIRGYILYYDAVQQNAHLNLSLRDAAACTDATSNAVNIFYLALGYQRAGDTASARKTCLMSRDPQARFTACAYMAATMGMAGELQESRFYLTQAQSELAVVDLDAQVDPYTKMMYGRALAYAGKVDKATEIYTQLDDEIDSIYVAAVLGNALRTTGHADVADAITRSVKTRFHKFKSQTRRRDYLYTCYGDFLATMGLLDDLNEERRMTRDPVLNANLLLGGAQALTDAYLYDR